MGNDRTVHCPKCGKTLRRISMDAERYKSFRIAVYDAQCDGCGIAVEIDDRSRFEQDGKIKITFN